MKALISPIESVQNGFRIVEVAPQEFPVAHPLYWIDVDDDVRPETHYFLEGVGSSVIPPTPTPEPIAPPVPTSVTPLEFIDRFTEDEQLAIVTATMSVPQVKLWYDKLLAAREVVFADPRLSSGLDGLVAAGLITAERKAEILPEAQTSGVTVL